MLQHHLPLLIISIISIGLIYRSLESKDVIFRVSMATAYVGLTLLAVTLVIGPLVRMFSRSHPVSTDLRRDLGFWSAIVSFAHVVFGLQVHLRGRMWLLFIRDDLDFPFIRFDKFGFANYTGLIAALVLIMLLATSNDRALNVLGKKKWKKIQRWNYGLFTIVLLHGVLYQVIEKRVGLYVYVFAAIGIIVAVTRIAESLNRKYKRK